MTKLIFNGWGRAGKSCAALKSTPKRSGSNAKPRPDPLPIDDIASLPSGPDILGRVIVPFPPAALSPNARGHWSKKARAAKPYRYWCMVMALKARLKVPAYAGTDGKIAVRLDFFPPDRTSRDDDNVYGSFKAGRDGIADAMKCDDGRFQTTNVLHDEPRSCVVVTLIAPDCELV